MVCQHRVILDANEQGRRVLRTHMAFRKNRCHAAERDIVRLRTNVRRERTYLYRLRIGPSAMRSLFTSCRLGKWPKEVMRL